MALDSFRSVADGVGFIGALHKAHLTPEERAAEERRDRIEFAKDTAIGLVVFCGIVAVWAAPFVALGWFARKVSE